MRLAQLVRAETTLSLKRVAERLNIGDVDKHVQPALQGREVAILRTDPIMLIRRLCRRMPERIIVVGQHSKLRLMTRRIHQRLLSWIWLMPIRLADKAYWRQITICDISPTAFTTSAPFCDNYLKVLHLIDLADAAAAERIAQNIRYIAHAYPLRGTCSYNYVAQLFLVNWTDLRRRTAEKELTLQLAVMLFNSATTGLLYRESPNLFGTKERDYLIQQACEQDSNVLYKKIASLLSDTA